LLHSTLREARQYPEFSSRKGGTTEMKRTIITLSALVILASIALAQNVGYVGGGPPATFNSNTGTNPRTIVYGAQSSADVGMCFGAVSTIASMFGIYNATTYPCNGLSGTPPVATGSCPIQTQVGGNTAGSFVMNGACVAGTVILTFTFTANNGWDCGAHDQTTLTDTLRISGSTITTATLTGTLAASDVVSFTCVPY
jgi:hypothetical protein